MGIFSRLRSLLTSDNKMEPSKNTFSTSSCRRFGHPEFVLFTSEEATLQIDVSWLLKYLESRVESGEQFRNGESIQIGWIYALIEELPDGMLTVTEPDMQAIPAKFVRSCDKILQHLRAQRDTVDSLTPSVKAEFPSMRQSVVVHVNYQTTDRILLSRFAFSELDSGWWLTDLNDKNGSQNPDQFIKISLYQLGIERPELIKFFALPPDLQVAIDRKRIGVIDSEGEIAQIPGSYLSELNRLLY